MYRFLLPLFPKYYSVTVPRINIEILLTVICRWYELHENMQIEYLKVNHFT